MGPSPSTAWKFIRLALLGAALLNTAQTAWAKSCSVDRRSPNEAELAEQREETSRALRLYRELVKLEPAEIRWQERTVQVELEESKTDAAWSDAQLLYASSPENGDALLAMSLASLARGDFALALSLAQRSIAVDPCNSHALLQLAKLQSLQGHRALASRTRDLAHRLAPNDFVVQAAWLNYRTSKQRSEDSASFLASFPGITEDQKQRFRWEAEAAALQASSGCTVRPSTNTTVVPFFALDATYVRPTDVPGLTVNINGHDTELELGAFGEAPIILTRSIANSLNLKRDTGTLVLRGQAARYLTHFDSLRVGEVEYRNCPAMVVDENFDVHFHGAVSVAFFRDFLITVDLAKRHLKLESLPQTETQQTLAGLWSDARIGGPETRSINAGDWSPNEPSIPRDKRDWMYGFDRGGNMLVPVSLGPNTERLFLLNYMSGKTVVLPSTAKDASPVANDNSLTPAHKAALRGARYSLRTGEVVLGIDNWNVETDVSTGGSLGEDMRQMRVTLDFRDDLVKVQHSAR